MDKSPEARAVATRLAPAARWASAVMLVALGGTGALPASAGEVCPQPQITVRGFWRPPGDWVWAYDSELPDDYVVAQSTFVHYGIIKTESRFEASTEVALSCRGQRCQSCPSHIEVNIGFTPGRVQLRDVLAANSCHARHIWEHELRHAEVYAAAEQWALERARASLASSLDTQAPLAVTDAQRDRASAYWNAIVGETVEAVYVAMVATAQRGNEPVDAIQNRAAEHRVAIAECGPLQP